MLKRNSTFSLTSSSGCSSSNQSSSSSSSKSSSTSNNILLSRSSDLKLDKVSQEERDAAHNLVSLHMQNRTRSRCNSSASVSTASTIQESENIENTPEVVVAYETRSKPSQTYQNSKWSVPNVQKQPFFQPTLSSSSSSSSHFQQPMYHPYYSNHLYHPEVMNINRGNEAAATASSRHAELMNPVSAVGRMHKYIEHPQCPSRRFNFAQF